MAEEVSATESSGRRLARPRICNLDLQTPRERPVREVLPACVQLGHAKSGRRPRPVEQRGRGELWSVLRSVQLNSCGCDQGLENAEQFEAWKIEHKIPETFTVISGREGFGAHMYFSGAVPTRRFPDWRSDG